VWTEFLPGSISSVLYVHAVSAGYLGVSLFYLLSGYVLSHVYLTDDTKLKDRNLFWVTRFARIYPMYAISFLLQLPPLIILSFNSVHRARTLSVASISLVFNLLMLQTWVRSLTWRWNQPSWSVSVEAFFYLMFPWLGSLIWRRLRWDNIFASMLSLYAASQALSIIAVYAIGHRYQSTSSRDILFDILCFNPVFRLPEFSLGIMLRKLDGFMRHEAAKRGLYAKCLVGGTLLVVMGVYYNQYLPYLSLYTGLLDPAFCLLILGCAGSTGTMSRLLSMRGMNLLGEASYSVYLLQVPMLYWYSHLIEPFHLNGVIALSLYCCFLTLISIFTHEYIELPSKRLIVAQFTLRRGMTKEQ
jgi:peptidoglycan/LPS O-acetylase OafA/YrhL